MPVPRVFESRILDSLIGSVLGIITGGGNDTPATDNSATNGGSSTTESPSTTSPSSAPTPTTSPPSPPSTTPTPTTSTPSTTSPPRTSTPSSTAGTPSSSTTDSTSTPSTDTAPTPTSDITSKSSSTTENTGTTDSADSTASTSTTSSSSTATNSGGSNPPTPSSGSAATGATTATVAPVDSTSGSPGIATSSSTSINAATSNGESSGQSSGWTPSNSGSSQRHTNGMPANSYTDGNASEQQGASVGSIIGITLAIVVGILLVAALGFWLVRRRQRKRARHGRPSSFAPEFGLEGGKPGAEDTIATHVDSSSTGAYTTLGINSVESSASSAQSALCLWKDEAITAIRIPMEKLTTTSIINRGGFGMVYKGSYRGEIVAVKMLLPGNRKDLHQINAFLTEIKMMSVLEHPRILRFVGVAWDQLTDLCAVSEFMEGGDLRSLLTRFEEKEHRPHGFDREKAQIAIHVAHALTYLHSLDPIVLHRDLKSKNILLTSNLEAKISDFGVSRESSDRTMTACVGTSLWMAPEVMMGERYGASADIFSFGLVLSELDSHELPYAAAKETDSGRMIPDTALLQLVSLGRLRAEFSPEAPQTLVNLGNACVELEPDARPSAGEVLYQLQLILQMYDECTR